MEEISIDTIELGNLIFGHSRGNFSIPRDEWEDILQNWLNENNFDGYANYQFKPHIIAEMRNDVYTFAEADLLKHNLRFDDNRFGVENDTFSIQPYYWGDDEEIMERPNFVYKPTNLTISWYKYPLRDAYCSEDITLDDFKKILEECSNSMKK